MCVIHFHPRVASAVGSVLRLLLRYGWIPCIFLIYAFPPHQAPTVIRDERAIPDAVTARIVTEKGSKIAALRAAIPNVALPQVPSLQQIIQTFTVDPERQELYKTYGEKFVFKKKLLVSLKRPERRG